MSDDNIQKMSCPYLGLTLDKSTYADFPSVNNACFHAQNAPTPKFFHQRSYCLTNKYGDCPIYCAPQGSPFPKKFQQAPEKKDKINSILLLALLMLLIFALLFIFYWRHNRQFSEIHPPTPIKESSTFTETSKVNKTITFTSTPSQTLMVSLPTPTRNIEASTRTPSPAPSATAILVFQLDTPIGKYPQFVIHRAIEGESLSLYANEYSTSVEAIRAVNFGLSRNLWIDEIVIIPLNRTDMAGIPPFIAYETDAEDTTFQKIAEDFSIPIEDLLRYNNAQADYPLYQGDWILIPQIGD